MMQYLLDSNVLITASERYYELGRIPQFWNWLRRQAENGAIKMPVEMIAEIQPTSYNQALLKWLSDMASELTIDELVQERLIQQVLSEGYQFETSDMGAGLPLRPLGDAILIAYALAQAGTRCVVTLEARQPLSRQLPLSHNRKIPLVCNLLGIRCIDTFELIRELDFRIPLVS